MWDVWAESECVLWLLSCRLVNPFFIMSVRSSSSNLNIAGDISALLCSLCQLIFFSLELSTDWNIFVAVFKRKLWWFNLKRYRVENVCHPLPAHLFFFFHYWTLKQCFGKGTCHYVVWMELLYVCCHMWMLCVLYQLNWLGERVEGESSGLGLHALHVYMYVCRMYYKAKGDIELFIFGLLELLQRQNFVLNGTMEWISQFKR